MILVSLPVGPVTGQEPDLGVSKVLGPHVNVRLLVAFEVGVDSVSE